MGALCSSLFSMDALRSVRSLNTTPPHSESLGTAAVNVEKKRREDKRWDTKRMRCDVWEIVTYHSYPKHLTIKIVSFQCVTISYRQIMDSVLIWEVKSVNLYSWTAEQFQRFDVFFSLHFNVEIFLESYQAVYLRFNKGREQVKIYISQKDILNLYMLTFISTLNPFAQGEGHLCT